MALADELRRAAGAEIGFELSGTASDRAVRVGALAWWPAAALARGLVAGAVGTMARPLGDVASAALAVAALAVGRSDAVVADVAGDGARGDGASPDDAPAAGPGAGPPRTSRRRMVARVGVLLAQLSAVAAMPAPARPLALALAPALGAWATVVQCYGGGAGAGLVGRARFREFGWGSVIAIGTALATLDAVGLAITVAAALLTVGLRLLAHRSGGRMTPARAAGTRDAVEVLVLAALAAAARVLA